MTHGSLLIADYRASTLHRRPVDAEGRSGRGKPVSPGPGVLAEHAGFLRLPPRVGADYAVAYADDQQGRLVLLGTDGLVRTEVPIAIPAEHLAASDCGSFIAVTTGCGMNLEPFSDVLTLIDLRPRRPRAVRVRVRVGEPGVAIVRSQEGELHVMLRHRGAMDGQGGLGPGAIEALGVEDILAAGPHVPQLRGESSEEIAPDGHGEVYDPVSRTMICATGRGLERFQILGGRPVALGVVQYPAAGRAFYLRYDPARRRVWSTLRGGEPDPAQWHLWQNWVMSGVLDAAGDLSMECSELPQGLVFRLDVAPGWAAGTVVSPHGDQVWRARVTDGGIEVDLGPLEPMSSPPTPGRAPWDGTESGSAQRRAVTVLPAHHQVALTRGGDGVVDIVGLTEDGPAVIDRLSLVSASPASSASPDGPAAPGRLDEGGHMVWLPAGADAGAGAEVDLIGR